MPEERHDRSGTIPHRGVHKNEKGEEEMTWLIVKTNEKEANEILNGNKRFFIRSDRDVINKGDNITFQLMRNGKSVYHPVGKKLYEVTGTYDYLTAPVQKGWQLICFR